MGEKDVAMRDVQAFLPTGEKAVMAVLCTIKGNKRTGAKAARTVVDVAVSAAASAALASTGFGVLRSTTAAPVWLVVTNQRFMVFRKRKIMGIRQEDLHFAAPLDAIRLQGTDGFLKSVTVIEAASSDPACSLNFGARTSAWKSVLGTVPSTNA